MSYFVPPIILSFSGARACAELCLYKEARSWLHMGLAVSFNECFKRDTRCNASNISREKIRSGEILKHIMQAMFSYTALSSLKKLKYSLRVLSTIPRNLTQKKRPYKLILRVSAECPSFLSPDEHHHDDRT